MLKKTMGYLDSTPRMIVILIIAHVIAIPIGIFVAPSQGVSGIETAPYIDNSELFSGLGPNFNGFIYSLEELIPFNGYTLTLKAADHKKQRGFSSS